MQQGYGACYFPTLLHIFEMDSDAVVAILSCDQHNSPDQEFSAALESGFVVAKTRPESVVPLRSPASSSESWIRVD